MAILHEEEEERTRFGDLDPEDSDFVSIEAFVEACIEDGEACFNWQHLALLAWNLSMDRSKVRAQLEAYGLKFQARPMTKRVRTISSNPHDRWHGLGSSPTHGGSGWEQIEGFAGPPG